MPLYRAREELIEKGYIRYEKGKGREAGTYTIIKIELYEKTEEGDYNLVPNMGNKGKHNEVLCNSLCNSLRPNMGTLNKQRQNNKYKEKKYIKKEMLEDENKNNILLLNNNLDNNKPATYWTRSWQEKGDFKEINLGPLGVTPKTNKNQMKEEKREYRETVKLTETEYNTLLNKLGEDKLNRALEVLNIYKLTSGRNYKSDYHIILNGWVLKRVEDDIKKEMLEDENKNNILLLNNNLDNNKPATYWTRSWQEKGDFKEINLGPLGVTPKTNKNQMKEEKREYRETVKLTETEYNTLLNKLGEDKLNRALEVLNIYKLTSGRNYKSDYHIILNGWVLKRVEDDIKKEQLKKNMIATQAITQSRKQREYEDFEIFDYLMYQ